MNEKYSNNDLDLYQNKLINTLHLFLKNNIHDDFVLISQISIKFTLFVLFIYLIDVLFYKIFKPFLEYIFIKYKLENGKLLIKYKLSNSISHLIPIFIAYLIFPYFFYHHPKSFQFSNHILTTLLLFVITQFLFRLIDFIEEFIGKENNSHKNIAYRSFGQLLKILIILVNGFFIFSLLFGIDKSHILTFLGTITAVFLLVFRDTILGFVAGVQISITKLVKENDWVSIPKYNIDGNVKEINLITTKIQNLDKTVSSIPTYDLIATEVKNFDPMHKSQARQIRRSIHFNIKSFKFIDEQLLNELLTIDLLKDYLEKSIKELNDFNKNTVKNNQKLINGRQLTNIGVFRKYVYYYLNSRTDISHKDLLIVRQLQATPQGLPLEILCFTNKTKLEQFEKIQSDVFDHLLTASKEFHLEVSQT